MNDGRRLGLGIVILKIWIIFLIIYLVISLLFKYLIKSNKIKSSKFSRMFYMDDENFIKNWDKNRKKGKFIYFLYEFALTSIVYLVTCIISIVVIGNDFNYPLFFGLLIGLILGLPFRWDRNEDKYYHLLAKYKNN